MQKEQKSGFGIVSIIIIIAAVAVLGGVIFYPKNMSRDGGGLIIPGEFHYVIKYDCLGFVHRTKQSPDFGGNLLCFGVRYNKQCSKISYDVSGKANIEQISCGEIPSLPPSPKNYGVRREEGNAITNQESSDSTLTWQTYRNEEYGFEVRYPQKWNDIILLDRPKELSRGSFTEGVFSVSIGFKGESVFYFVLKLDEQKTIQDYIKADPEYFVSYAISKESSSDTIVGNINAKQFTIDSSESGRWKVVLWERNGVSYMLVYRLEDDSERELFEGILSTFKFIK